MTEKRITIDFIEYASPEEMETQDRELVEAALRARAGSYSPYSKFRVGAALRLVDGTIVLGANQENIAYPSGLCAERTAMFAAGANHPGVAFDTLAIVGGNGDEVCEMPATPCGACRQVMAECESRHGRPIELFCYLQGGKIRRITGADSLLPFAFGAELG